MNLEFIFQAISWILGVWVFIAKMDKRIEVLSSKIDVLSEKQSKYNNLQERTLLLEVSAKEAHKRIDELRREQNYERSRNGCNPDYY